MPGRAGARRVPGVRAGRAGPMPRPCRIGAGRETGPRPAAPCPTWPFLAVPPAAEDAMAGAWHEPRKLMRAMHNYS
jgi:hypothetical protein